MPNDLSGFADKLTKIGKIMAAGLVAAIAYARLHESGPAPERQHDNTPAGHIERGLDPLRGEPKP